MRLTELNTKYLWIFLAGLLVWGCDLTETPQSTASSENVFGDETGLQLYVNSLYNILPTANNVFQGDAMADYSARRDVPAFLREGAFGPSNSSGWSWGDLRNINYFLENNTNTDIPEGVRQHYNGIARFFRAMFYFEKVKRFGDVPWIETDLDIDDPKLYEGRDPREMVMENVLEDINFAIEHITSEPEGTRTRVSVDVALALKSRIALFEGTFRKYHPDLGLADTAEGWLIEARDAAQEIVDRGNFSLNTGDPETSYEQLFKTDNPNPSEDMLVVAHDTEMSVLHPANWWYTSSTYGVRLSLIRPFIHTYLMLDGTAFTDQPDYETMFFPDEMADRDLRLSQTIRTPGYTRIDAGQEVETAPDFAYVYTGYHPHKWTLDDTFYDGWTNNTNSVPIFRYAEVLLNLAEAKAELGEMDDADWAATVGALRSRAGITGGTETLPTVVDTYLQETYFPDINDPILLEVRRERGIELVLEGFRFYDIVRWARGELMEMPWVGIYIPELDEHLDLNVDGEPDVYFHQGEPPSDQQGGVVYIDLSGEGFDLTEDMELIWREDIPRTWDDKRYLYPIPEGDLQTNPNLGQNPGWQ